MDEAIQIKNNLISRIKDSNDLDFLKALQTIFESSDRSVFELNDLQKALIEKGRKDIQNGEYMENHKVISELKEWLKKK